MLARRRLLEAAGAVTAAAIIGRTPAGGQELTFETVLPIPELRPSKRIIWFKPPEEALANPIELMAYAMKASTDEEMALLLEHIGPEGLTEAIDNAPPGIITPRSWSYWNAKIGRYPAPPMPSRCPHAWAASLTR